MTKISWKHHFIAVLITTLICTPSFASPKKKTPPPAKKEVAKEVKSKSQENYEKGKMAVDTWNYEEALKYFKAANAEDKNNPDILNMLAYAQRNLGMIDEALENYHQALKLRPKFPEAREYLAEAYMKAALREADILKGYGEAGKEELRKLKEAFKKAADSL